MSTAKAAFGGNALNGLLVVAIVVCCERRLGVHLYAARAGRVAKALTHFVPERLSPGQLGVEVQLLGALIATEVPNILALIPKSESLPGKVIGQGHVREAVQELGIWRQ